ncbi:hypothetical protein GCM10010112_07360 [Actinoplanes lobatus]|uniref:Uncharacterized protein n=1 Tax=Actinoplanes lobatus TaxID=113568 RepID=A0A7W7HAR4_9ACTN|nr:hypothetical protein [Actinoplanes lobatus]MBB4747156.1 hypothetical protein [Actinoplanes lobatus]GGN55983.1 hypothetical protein GCM10010112_07360 [Actinoplanes lobatus]GIE39276.1 hypothetical protein Alo02nite_21740 [Actinoplanes lobatus]
MTNYIYDESHALAAADAAGRALEPDDEARPTLREVLGSSGYPMPASSAPDRFVRLLADLVPGWLAEPPESAVDFYLAVAAPDRSMGVSITVGLPGEQGYLTVDEWCVTGTSTAHVALELTLNHDAGTPAFEHAIRVLRAHGALPAVGQ